MSYTDIVPESEVFSGLRFNGNFNHFGQTRTAFSGIDSTSENAVFVNDHPFEANGQSFRITGRSGGNIVSTRVSSSFGINGTQNFELTGGSRNTFEVWFKYTLVDGRVPAFVGGNGVFLQLFSDDAGTTGTSIEVRLIGGGLYGSGGAGSLGITYLSSGTNTARTGVRYYPPNEWHCLHVEFQRDNATLKNRPYFYVNGRLDNCASSAVTGHSYTSDGISRATVGMATNQVGNANVDGAQFFISEARYFRRNLTNREKMLRANYGRMTTNGLKNTILADNPKIYLTCDNTTQFPVEQLGDPTWGTGLLSTWSTGQTHGRIVYGTNVLVNQTGDRGKSWSFPAAGTSTSSITVGGNTSAKMKELLHDRTKSITMEWFTLNPTYDPAVASNGTANFINIGRRAGTAVTGGIGGFSANTGTNNGSPTSTGFIGRHSVSLDFWNGTAWANGNANTVFSDSPISGASQINYANYADNQWHHHVFTISRTENGMYGIYYFDGFKHTERDFGATSNSVAFNDAANWATELTRFTFGPYTQPSTAYNRRFTLDNFAIYDYVLTPEQVKQHYYAFAAQDPSGNPVRYWNGSAWIDSADQLVWNGTAWVDWGAQRWDGTQWTAVA